MSKLTAQEKYIKERNQQFSDAGWPYNVDLLHLANSNSFDTITTYAKSQFNDNVTWAGLQFWFRNEEDATMFILRRK